MKTKIIVLISLWFVCIALAWWFLLFNRITKDSSAPIQNADLQADIQWKNTTDTEVSSGLIFSGQNWSQDTGAAASAIAPTTSPTTPTPTIVRILFPPWISQEDIQTLTTSIRQTVGVESNVVRAESMQIYEIARRQAFASTTTTSPRDIVMISTKEHTAINEHSKHIPFTQDISPYFTSLLGFLVRNEWGTFIPYALDPVVTVLHKQATTTPSWFSWHLFQHIIASPLQRELPHISSFFGVSPTDVTALRATQEAYPWYTDTLFTFVDQALLSETPGILSYLTQIPTRDLSRFTSLVATITEKLPQCSTLPIQCLLRFQLTDIGFVHLSDLDLLRSSFPQGQRRENSYIITNFPSTTLGYPVDAWWFVIPQWVQNPARAYKRIEGYLQLATQQRLVSSSYTLSPFAETLQTQVLQQFYQYIRDQVTYGYITTIYTPLHDDPTFKERLRDVLDQKYSPEIFVQQYKQK